MLQTLWLAGFYLGFKIGGGGGGGGGRTIVDNVAVGGECGRGMCPLPCEVRKLRHFMILKKAKFQHLCDKRRHY